MGRVETQLAEKNTLEEIAKSIRSLSIDAIDKANSGHPGLPLGCADIVAYLYANILRFDPKKPEWFGRDRFILSAGHGSMVLYAVLHIAGYDVSRQDIKDFRKMGSNTPGHPEYGMTPGVETTTGPLGQGLATAVGMALAAKQAKEQFKIQQAEPHYYVLSGDGDLMEGIASEASSLAGHLKLNNLTVIYDANDICLDGPITECFTENVEKRYEAYGWNVVTIDGHDFDDIEKGFKVSKEENQKPTLIIAKTTIGIGSPNRAGTSEAHGKPLGESEGKLTKESLGIPLDELFWVSNDAITFFKEKSKGQQKDSEAWESQFENDLDKNGLAFEWTAAINKLLPDNLKQVVEAVEMKENAATRVASNTVMQTLKAELPYLTVGSADLSCSDNTVLKNEDIISAGLYGGRNIKFGVREFAMAAMANGIAIEGVTLPVVGTFLTFSDYMRNAVRLSALMNQKVIYHFTHDSIFLGEDGPTHQPVEHVASLRAMPNLTVIRPADANEVKGAWLTAVSSHGPVALILSRLSAIDIETTEINNVQKGAYIVHKESGNSLDKVIIATGTEVALAIEVAKDLTQKGQSVRVVSMPSMELFKKQSKEYQDEILGTDVSQYVVIEAGTQFGWHQFVGRDAIFITVETFGESAPSADLAKHFGFTKEAVLEQLVKAS